MQNRFFWSAVLVSHRKQKGCREGFAEGWLIFWPHDCGGKGAGEEVVLMLKFPWQFRGAFCAGRKPFSVTLSSWVAVLRQRVNSPVLGVLTKRLGVQLPGILGGKLSQVTLLRLLPSTNITFKTHLKFNYSLLPAMLLTWCNLPSLPVLLISIASYLVSLLAPLPSRQHRD